MERKFFCSLIALFVGISTLFAQLGIKAGVNMANEIKSFNQSGIASGFVSSNLTGYEIGLVYQLMPKKSGLGVEIGALLSQKGSSFNDSTSIVNRIKQGYKELNYLDVPLNLRYRFTLGLIGIYGFGGLYAGYALSGKTVDEIANVTQNETFSSFANHLDYGYNFGVGVELFRKIQFGGTWSEGLKNTLSSATGLPTPINSTNRVFTVNLVYLF
ncbi:MAG: porin family protein [Paludibacter sp.]|nr:porin family protein [Paludibacter sp.]